MKTKTLISIMVLAALLGCKTENQSNTKRAIFGIYETIPVNELPSSFTDSLKTLKIQLEEDATLPIIGYFLNNESIDLFPQKPQNGIKLVKTAFTVDPDKTYKAIVAVKEKPLITNADIRKTRPVNNRVEIYFNLRGTKKWAAITKQNIGKQVAFIIDNQIYTMPLINGEINNGMALINRLPDETVAVKISEALNGGTAD